MKQELANRLKYDALPRVAVMPYATVEDDPNVLPRHVANLCRRASEIGSVTNKNEALASCWAFQDFASIAALGEQFMNSKICAASAAPHTRAS